MNCLVELFWLALKENWVVKECNNGEFVFITEWSYVTHSGNRNRD